MISADRLRRALGRSALGTRHWVVEGAFSGSRSDARFLVADSPMVPASEVRSFRQLLVWQRAMDLAIGVHLAARSLPMIERFELGRELRRSAISIPSNIAEGFNRHSRATYRSHVAIALGSTGELETQLEMGIRLKYLGAAEAEYLLQMTVSVARLLQGLWRSLE